MNIFECSRDPLDIKYFDVLKRQEARRRDEAMEKEYYKQKEARERLRAHYENLRTDSLIKDVIFDKGVTIVFWSDGTKTVVHCQPGDKYDAEKGLLACMAKKFYGGNGFNRALAKWCPVQETKETD